VIPAQLVWNIFQIEGAGVLVPFTFSSTRGLLLAGIGGVLLASCALFSRRRPSRFYLERASLPKMTTQSSMRGVDTVWMR
jgi:hypothetical protein